MFALVSELSSEFFLAANAVAFAKQSVLALDVIDDAFYMYCAVPFPKEL